jgi:hypothetical protein
MDMNNRKGETRSEQKAYEISIEVSCARHGKPGNRTLSL